VVDPENMKAFSHFYPYPGGVQSSRIKICSVISVGINCDHSIARYPYILFSYYEITDNLISYNSCASLGKYLYNHTIPSLKIMLYELRTV